MDPQKPSLLKIIFYESTLKVKLRKKPYISLSPLYKNILYKTIIKTKILFCLLFYLNIKRELFHDLQ